MCRGRAAGPAGTDRPPGGWSRATLSLCKPPRTRSPIRMEQRDEQQHNEFRKSHVPGTGPAHATKLQPHPPSPDPPTPLRAANPLGSPRLASHIDTLPPGSLAPSRQPGCSRPSPRTPSPAPPGIDAPPSALPILSASTTPTDHRRILLYRRRRRRRHILPDMDSAAVRGLLAASLDADADNRRRAEIQLKQVRFFSWALDPCWPLEPAQDCAPRSWRGPHLRPAVMAAALARAGTTSAPNKTCPGRPC